MWSGVAPGVYGGGKGGSTTTITTITTNAAAAAATRATRVGGGVRVRGQGRVIKLKMIRE